MASTFQESDGWERYSLHITIIVSEENLNSQRTGHGLGGNIDIRPAGTVSCQHQWG